MSVAELLEELSRQQVQVWVDGDRLRYRSPKGRLSPELKGRIKACREELMAELNRRAATPQSLPSLVPDPARRHQPFPLTDIQQAYLVGRSDDLELGAVSCHGYLEVDARDLDLERFTRAWRRLIDHHGMLRVVVSPDGTQRILEEVPPFTIDTVDLRDAGEEETTRRLTELRDALSHEVRKPDEWPLFDIRAALLDDRLTRLFLSFDLLGLDAASIVQVFDEVAELYEDPERQLEELSISFRDYVLAEEELERSEGYRRARRYWLERLDALPPPPALPLAANPAELAEHRFRRHATELAREDWQRLEAHGKEHGLTPSGVLLAAFSEVLGRFAGEPEMTLNLTFFQKLPLHPEVESLVGDFTSLLLLAIEPEPGTSFAERARSLQTRLWEDMDHGEFSGVEVLREMARSRGKASDDRLSVVFTSLLNQDTTAEREPMLGWLGEIVYSVTQTPQVLLDHQVYERHGALVLNWDVLDGLLPEGLIEEMFTVYRNLLERLARRPESWEESAPVRLTGGQLAPRHRANATAGALPDALLHEPFEARAAESPERPAVITPERTLTYGELAHRAHLLGAELRRRGAEPGKLVAVVAEKGWEQVAGVLGVLASGAAYLPVDPNLPAERVCHLLEVGEVELAVTTPTADGAVDWPAHIERLTVCSEPPSEDDPGPLEPVQDEEDLAYVIFTSGSTGKPKGVMIDHRGAANTVFDMNRRWQVGPEDRVLGISALNFDLSVYDLFGPLAVGGALVLPAPEGLRDPEHWAELVFDHRVTLWNSVPALVEMLIEHVELTGESLPGSLRTVWMSGDWIPTSLPERIRAKGAAIEVVSLGGATEASIWSIYYPIEAVDPAWTSIPYGRPLTNQTFHVLDADLEPRPTWVPGELYIGGIGVAKGYWKDPERTAAQFFPHPKTGEPLYRTGDLGRYLPDGDIEFLGRRDFQVKIRGYRIELGEIEAALDEHPAVRRAVVSAVGEPRGERRLVAYVVGDFEGPNGGGPMPAGLDSVELVERKVEGGALRELPGEADTVELPQAGGELPDPFARVSHRRFLGDAVRLEELSRLLAALRQIDTGAVGKRLYPSAGHLYPVQLYLHVKPGRVEGLDGGLYYHHPVAHRLVPLAPGLELPTSVHASVNQPVYEGAAFSLFLVARLDAIAPVYGEELGRHLATLEAGYMGQLLMQAAEEGELGLCPIGGMETGQLEGPLELGRRTVLIHSLVGGAVEPVAPHEWPVAPATGAEPADPAGELKEFVAGKIPEYMVPSAFVFLDELPLSANGKVDRSRLPEPGAETGSETHDFVAPRTATEKTLAAIWKEILGVEAVGIHDDFFDSGGDSLKATRVVHRCREAFDVELPLRIAFAATSIARLGEEIEALGGGGASLDAEPPAALDLPSKVRLDPDIRPDPERMPEEATRTAPGSILLTGATGFLGAYLTADLLRRTDAELTCLVRADSPEEGRARVRRALAERGLWEPAWEERLTAVPGDLTRPRLGLTEERFAELAESLEAIVHNGAVISFSRPYETLEPVNVHGTHEVLRLACAGRVKPLHFVSTINFFFSTPYLEGVVTEDDPCEHHEALDVGYAQSKWVAERLVREASGRGLPTAIYRPGMITGDTDSGHSNEDDFFSRFLKGCIELGAAPDINMTVDMVPVDFVSAAIATLLGRPDTLGGVFHLVNGDPPSAGELMDWVRGFGFPLERLSYEAWRERLLAVATDEASNALYPLLPIFLEGTTTSALWTSEDGRLRFDARRARRALEASPVEWPEGSAELLERYLERFVDSGYLEAPTAGAEPQRDSA